MKSVFISVLLLWSAASFAQKVSVTPSLEKFDDEFHPAFKLYIPFADERTVSKEWASLLKDHNAKVKTSKDGLTATNALLTVISKDPMQVNSTFTEDKEGTMLITAFQANDEYISNTENPDQSQSIITVLHDFGLRLAKEGHAARVNEATKLVDTQVKEKDALIKRNERLRSDNEKMKHEINENEREVRSNEDKVNKLNDEITSSKSALDALRAKSSELE